MARVLVSGMLAGDPGQGGATWAVLQWILGLRRLGHDVWALEPVRELRADVVAYFGRVAAAFGLQDRAALVGPGRQVVGQAPEDAELLLDVAGMLRDDELFGAVPTRVYLDLDPAFTQLWHTQGIEMRLEGHTHFATVGLALGSTDCPVPTLGRDWITTPPPVVLERWPFSDRIRHDAFTTVGNWRSYGTLEANGMRYGQRAHTVRGLIELPGRTAQPITPALAIDDAEEPDLRALAANGWHLLSAEQMARTPARYHDFVQGSRAELGLPKEGYVVGRTGWFSDRSACYLASGRPVLLQETGFSTYLPTGEGLLAYDGVDSAAEGIATIVADYEHHRREARALAEGLLDSDVVLANLLGRL